MLFVLDSRQMPKALLKLPRLAQLRSDALLTQKELAERAGINVMTVSDIERGQSATPATVKKLAKALGIKGPELLGD